MAVSVPSPRVLAVAEIVTVGVALKTSVTGPDRDALVSRLSVGVALADAVRRACSCVGVSV